MTDLCAICQRSIGSVTRSTNHINAEKRQRTEQLTLHLDHVDRERDVYRGMVNDAKKEIPDGEILKQNPANSRQMTAHYSFDFAQQIHFPSDPLQPGPIYFLCPRKCGIFGVCCEAILMQVNYFIDEGMAGSKGSNAVISYVHHFFGHYGLGESHVHMHCDNCSGQNKNKIVQWYLAWRTIHKMHDSMALHFLIAGHTKFAPDWCFGLLKKKYKVTPVASLDDIVEMCKDSSHQGVNVPQLVGTEDGDVKVPTYDWQKFLGNYFKPLKGIKSLHHMRYVTL